MVHEEACSWLLIRGCPIDDPLADTPATWRAQDRELTPEFDSWLIFVAAQFGEPFSWAHIQHGALIGHVLPMYGREYEQTGHSSRVRLDLHVEDAFDDARCQYLVLGCLRNDDVRTTLASVDDVAFSESDVAVLSAPGFLFEPDGEYLRNQRMSGEHVAPPQAAPVLFGDPRSPYLRIDAPYMTVIDDEPRARDALDRLLVRLESAKVQVTLQPGDILVIDNWRVAHGREAFTPRYDGKDRWLRRTMVNPSLRPTRARRLGPDDRIVQSTSSRGGQQH
jgi:hypothetical protein